MKLLVNNLKAQKEDLPILDGVTFELSVGERVLLMGPNGSGKTTLAMALLGSSGVEVSGDVLIENGKKVDLLKLSITERAKAGLYIGFQLPVEIPGVSAYEMLFEAYRSISGDAPVEVDEVRGIVDKYAAELGIDAEFLSRGLNEGFSGGEKKKMELLQMLVLKPKLAILDEPDSGLDADSVKYVNKALSLLGPDTGVLIISHDPRRLGLKDISRVYIIRDGKIVENGGMELIDRVGNKGYDFKN